MIGDKRVLALVTARGGSKGLPGKNLRELCGKPLVGWPIDAALNSRYVDMVVLSTDDRKIADKGLELGAKVPFMRPAELASDTATSASVVEHAINSLKDMGDCFDYVVLLEPTSPLTEAPDVDFALEALDAKRSVADSIVGVSRVGAAHPVFDVEIGGDGLIKPYSGADFSAAMRRQDIKELYFFEGSLYISDVKTFLLKKKFYHDRTLPYVVPKWKSFEVDDIVDLLCIEAIMRNIDSIKKNGG